MNKINISVEILESIRDIENVDDKVKLLCEYFEENKIKMINMSESSLIFMFGKSNKGFIARTLSSKLSKYNFKLKSNNTMRGRILKIRKVL